MSTFLGGISAERDEYFFGGHLAERDEYIVFWAHLAERDEYVGEPGGLVVVWTGMASSVETRSQTRATSASSRLAKALAPEEIRAGDFVTPLHVVAEVPSYFWCDEAWDRPRDEPVRIRFTPTSDGLPLKVKSVCLPFVLVKHASGAKLTIDVRTCQLARLDARFGKLAWKGYRKTRAGKK